MNINSDYSSKELKDPSNVELTQTALDAIEDNIISKVADQLKAIDYVGFATVRVLLEEVAKKADAYEVMTSKKNHFYKN
jgi:hypothetical protein